MLCKTKCSQSQRGEYYTKENKRFDLKETINQVAGSCSKCIPANKCCQRYMYSVSTVFFSLSLQPYCVTKPSPGPRKELFVNQAGIKKQNYNNNYFC